MLVPLDLLSEEVPQKKNEAAKRKRNEQNFPGKRACKVIGMTNKVSIPNP